MLSHNSFATFTNSKQIQRQTDAYIFFLCVLSNSYAKAAKAAKAAKVLYHMGALNYFSIKMYISSMVVVFSVGRLL